MNLAEYGISSEEIINLLLLVFIVVTVYAVIKGVRESMDSFKDLKNGKSIEDVKADMKEKARQKEEAEQKKFESKIYRITHPLDYGNYILFKKIDEKLYGKEKADAKRADRKK